MFEALLIPASSRKLGLFQEVQLLPHFLGDTDSHFWGRADISRMQEELPIWLWVKRSQEGWAFILRRAALSELSLLPQYWVQSPSGPYLCQLAAEDLEYPKWIWGARLQRKPDLVKMQTDSGSENRDLHPISPLVGGDCQEHISGNLNKQAISFHSV